MKEIKIDTNEEFIGKYIYVKQSNKDADIHRILRIYSIIEEIPISFAVKNHNYFTIPFNHNCKCFHYKGNETYEPNDVDKMYVMSENEFVDTFRNFMKYNGRHPYEIPAKIIQDT